MFIQYENTIKLNDLNLTIEEFKILEPNIEYLPRGYDHLIYNPGKEHEVSGFGQSTIKKPLIWEDGNRYLSRYEEFKYLKKTLQKDEDIELVEFEIRKTLPHKEARSLEYPNIDNLIIALWEHIVENKSFEESNINNLQKLREIVKSKYPKRL